MHPQHSSGALALPVAFIISSFTTLIHTNSDSQLVLSKWFELVNEGCFWSSQWEALPPWNSSPNSMNPIGACCWLFIIWLFRRQHIFLQWFRHHWVLFLRLKATAKSRHLYLGVSPKHANKYPRMATSVCCSDNILLFQWQISDQKEPLVYLVICFSWRNRGNLDPFLYQELSHIGIQVVEKFCGDI